MAEPQVNVTVLPTSGNFQLLEWKPKGRTSSKAIIGWYVRRELIPPQGEDDEEDIWATTSPVLMHGGIFNYGEHMGRLDCFAIERPDGTIEGYFGATWPRRLDWQMWVHNKNTAKLQAA